MLLTNTSTFLKVKSRTLDTPVLETLSSFCEIRCIFNKYNLKKESYSRCSEVSPNPDSTDKYFTTIKTTWILIKSKLWAQSKQIVMCIFRHIGHISTFPLTATVCGIWKQLNLFRAKDSVTYSQDAAVVQYITTLQHRHKDSSHIIFCLHQYDWHGRPWKSPPDKL